MRIKFWNPLRSLKNFIGTVDGKRLTPVSAPPIPGEGYFGIANTVSRLGCKYFAPDSYAVSVAQAQRTYALLQLGLSYEVARQKAGLPPTPAGNQNPLGLLQTPTNDPEALMQLEALRLAFFAFAGQRLLRDGVQSPASEEEFFNLVHGGTNDGIS